MAVPEDEDRATTALDPTALRALVDHERAAVAPRSPRPRARQTALDPGIVMPGGPRYLARGSTRFRASKLRAAEPAPARYRTRVLVVVGVLAAAIGAASTYFY